MTRPPASPRPRDPKPRMPFAWAAYAMVDSPACAAGVGWTPDGRAIEVRDETFLCDHVLPKFFQHGNLSSFVRQLNIYGFEKEKCSKREGVSHIFSNPNFFRGGQDKLYSITRKNSWRQAEKLQNVDEDKNIIHVAPKVEKRVLVGDRRLNLIERLDQLEKHNRRLEEQNKKLRATLDDSILVQSDIQSQMKGILQLINMPSPSGKSEASYSRVQPVIAEELTNFEGYVNLTLEEANVELEEFFGEFL